MQIGFVGLGRMGFNMTHRVLKAGHKPAVFDLNQDALHEAGKLGAAVTANLSDFANVLSAPRAVWVMVPAGKPTHDVIRQLIETLSPGDIIIDGGNSRYTDAMMFSEEAGKRGIYFLDAGTSGGIWGLENGYCLMIGGEKKAFETVEPIFKALAPENGYIYTGESGSGHFTKMVHNGIEYGMLQALGEGFELLEKSGFDLNLAAISHVWQHGSVVRSWLLDLASDALDNDAHLGNLEAFVADSGEGRWTVETAIEKAVPTPVIAASLFARFSSRDKNSFSARFIAALRNEFGGHAIKTRK
jgi:6-phosphogluconate dehydrogenase